MATSANGRHQASREADASCGLSVSVNLPRWAREYLKLLVELERCGLTVEMPQVLADILKETEIEIAL